MRLLVAILALGTVARSAHADETSSGWFFSVGTSIRSIQSGFQLNPSSPMLDWQHFFVPRAAQGDTGLYTGGADTIQYLGGFVGPQNPDLPVGLAQGQVDSSTQILPHPVGTGGAFANAVIAYGATAFEYRPETDAGGVADEGTGAGPSFQWGYRLADTVNLVSGWTFLSTNHTTGSDRVANVFEDQLNFTILYDYIADANSGIQIPGTVNGQEQGIVSNADLLTPIYGPGYESPRRSVDVAKGREARFYAVSRADLEVSLQEIPFGIEIGHRVGPLECYLTGGATLNLIDYDLTSRLDWFESGLSTPRFSGSWRDTGNPLKAGLFGGLTAKLFLNDSKRIYVEGSTSYRWVDPVHASAGIVDVEIDVSSWEGRFGFGIVLD